MDKNKKAKENTEDKELTKFKAVAESLAKETKAEEEEIAKSTDSIGFTTHFLAQASLPYTDPKTDNFSRGSGRLILSVRGDPKYGIPYGSVPRILLAWMCTTAVKTRDPNLYLGKSQNEFLTKLNMYSNTSYINSLKNQIMRLIRSLITVQTDYRGASAFENILIAKRALIWWDNKPSSGKVNLWESTLTLSTDFYDILTKHSIPIKMDVLNDLRKSPLAMDIYTWLVYRMFTLKLSSKFFNGQQEVKIPWESLQQQFGSGFPNTPRGLRNFKISFLKHLKSVLEYYPEAKDGIEVNESCIKLNPVELHVPQLKFGKKGFPIYNKNRSHY